MESVKDRNDRIAKEKRNMLDSTGATEARVAEWREKTAELIRDTPKRFDWEHYWRRTALHDQTKIRSFLNITVLNKDDYEEMMRKWDTGKAEKEFYKIVGSYEEMIAAEGKRRGIERPTRAKLRAYDLANEPTQPEYVDWPVARTHDVEDNETSDEEDSEDSSDHDQDEGDSDEAPKNVRFAQEPPKKKQNVGRVVANETRNQGKSKANSPARKSAAQKVKPKPKPKTKTKPKSNEEKKHEKECKAIEEKAYRDRLAKEGIPYQSPKRKRKPK